MPSTALWLIFGGLLGATIAAVGGLVFYALRTGGEPTSPGYDDAFLGGAALPLLGLASTTAVLSVIL